METCLESVRCFLCKKLKKTSITLRQESHYVSRLSISYTLTDLELCGGFILDDEMSALLESKNNTQLQC